MVGKNYIIDIFKRIKKKLLKQLKTVNICILQNETVKLVPVRQLNKKTKKRITKIEN